MQYYDITVPSSGAQFPIASPGRFLYYLSGSAGGADSTIRVRAGNTGAAFLLKPGQSIRLPDDTQEVDTWYLTNYGMVAPILGQVLIGDGDFNDNRISGSVEVIDGGKARTLGGGAFCTSISVGAGAGVVPICQLWNPAGSGKNAVISRFIAGTDTAGAALCGLNTAVVGATAATVSKKAGGAAGAALQATSTGATPGGVSRTHTINMAANTSTIVTLSEPIVLPPGYGFVVSQSTSASGLFLVVEHFEENI